MDKLPDLFEKIALNTYDPDSSYHVKITHINNPYSFYARPIAYTAYLSSLEAKGVPINAKELQLKKIVIFKSKKLNKFVRGSVSNIENDNCDIFTIDYGFLEKKVAMSDVYEPELLGVPPLAVHCKLANCKPITAQWEDKAIAGMKFFVGEERALLCVAEKSPQILTVVLKNSCPDDIALMLLYAGHSTLGYTENQISRLTSPSCQKLFFTYKKLKVNDCIRVRVQSGTLLNDFYVADKQDYQMYLDQRDNFSYFSKHYCKPFNKDSFEVNVPVGVLDDRVINKYERGIIKEFISESTVRVQLVDWGNTIETKIHFLREMSERFFHYPASAIHCSLDESQLSDTELLKCLYKGNEFFITITKVSDKIYKPHFVKITLN